MTVAVEPETPPAERLPKILMIVGNDVSIDTRVRKIASTVASTGLPVTVLGLSSTGARTETTMGPVRVIRVPVLWKLRDDARKRQNRVRSRWTFGYESKDAYVVARRKQVIREREAKAAYGRWRDRRESVRASGARPLDQRKLEAERVWLKAWRTQLKVRRKVQQVREGIWRRNAAALGGERARDRRSLQAVLEQVPRRGGWRRLMPAIEDYELAFGPLVDELEPDIIHAHDVHLVGVAERAVARARNRGCQIRWIYDAHEYVPGLARPTQQMVDAYVDLEREYIHSASRVVTVCDPLADILHSSYDLPRRPTVVMNIPIQVERTEDDGPSLRRAAGLPEGVPIMVYSGGVNHSRGVETCIQALPHLPDVHLVIVANQVGRYIRSLRTMANELGCGTRFHLCPFVAPDQVSTYLSSADVALNPLLHYGNYEVALPNKYFEYLHARLPIANSDVKATAEMTRRTQFGEVFTADDPADLARAVRTILADRETYVKRIRESEEVRELYTWRHQEHVLVDMYAELLGLPLELSDELSSLAEIDPVLGATAKGMPGTGDAAVAPIRLAMGPRNMAGQAWAWCRALERAYPDLRAEVYTLEKNSSLLFPTDHRIPKSSWYSLEWQLGQVSRLSTDFTHVLMESGNGLCGSLLENFFGELPLLRAHDVKAALVFHGSDIRDPRRHRELEPHSPFSNEDQFTLKLQDGIDRIAPLVEAFEGPVFVSTLELLQYVPRGIWLPVVVDPAGWGGGPPPLEREKPVVVHIPSNNRLKGSERADLIATELAEAGIIEYRRLSAVPVEEMPVVIREADVVLDQFALGDYGVAACEAMAAGRVVVGHVSARVRQRLEQPLPIVEATLDTLDEVLTDIADRPDAYRGRGSEGVAFVAEHHDGRLGVDQLAPFLGRGEQP